MSVIKGQSRQNVEHAMVANVKLLFVVDVLFGINLFFFGCCFWIVCAFMLTNTCMSCPDIQNHTDAPDFAQRRGSNSVRSALPAAFHARPLRAAEESRLCYFHLSGILPAHWPAPVPAARHLCGATTHIHTHTPLRTHKHTSLKNQAISQ